MDLPTYTNIWRLERRLYKLYDFRLPMPLPINWIAVFVGITVPYIVLLIAIGLPFNHSLVWLYVLPPGVLTWLTTRPVIEGKRLPELVQSQARYLAEPRTFVRLAPLSEKDQMTLTARVWRSRRPARRPAPGREPAPHPGTVKRPALPAAQPGRQVGTLRPEPVLKPTSIFRPEPRPGSGPPQRTRGQERVRVRERARDQERVRVPERPRTTGLGQDQRQVLGQAPVRPAPALPPPARQLPPPGPQAPPSTWPNTPGPTPSASQPAAPPQPVPPSPVRGRARAGGSGTPGLEVSHDAPRRRRFGAKPAQPVRQEPGRQEPGTPLTPPGDPVREWPVPARPLRPVPSAGDDATVAPQAENSPAAPPSPASAPPIQEPEPEAVPPAPAVLPAPEPQPAEPAAEAPQPPRWKWKRTVHVEPAQAPAPAVAAPPAEPAAAPGPAPVPVAPVPVATVQQVTDPKQSAVPSVERALSSPARDRSSGPWGGKVKVVTGNGAAQGPRARDQEARDRNRARLPVAEPKRVLVLGCTNGAGQSVTALMTASMLASLREHPVAAVDLHDGTLARYRAPAAWLEELLAGQPPQRIRPTRPDGLHPTPKPSPGRLDVVASHEPLKDGDEIKLAVQLNRHYPLTLLDPGAAALTRLLKVTDQLVVVVPANVDGAGALADTRDWLDNNGHADLAMQAVTVINGVSRRMLADVENAESIARGRSRAIVRVPWDDMLPLAAANPSTLRPQTRVAYTALAGVLVAGLAATPVRKKQ